MFDDFDTSITCEEYYADNDYSYTITEAEYASACADLDPSFVDEDVPF